MPKPAAAADLPAPRDAPSSHSNIEAALHRFAGARGPLRRVLAAVSARVVETRGWERLGFARLGDCARERVGLSARQVQDLARVDAALADLPRTEAELVAGNLSWTKVRLLCRVATPVDELHWISLAHRLRADELAREVRAVDLEASGARGLHVETTETDEDGASLEPKETVRIRCTPDVRAKFWRARQLAQRAAGETLPPWACMEAVAAEVLSALPLDDSAGLRRFEPLRSLPAPPPPGSERRSASADANAPPTEVSSCTAASSELPPFLNSLVVGLSDADAFELDDRLRRAVALEQRLDAQLGTWLLAAFEARLHRWRGFANFGAFARERLGIAPRKAHALIRLVRAGRRYPALAEAFRDARLSWTQAHLLIPVLHLRDADPELWIAHAGSVSVRRIEEDVERALATGQSDPRLLNAAPAGLQIGAPATDSEEDPLASIEASRFFFTGPSDVARLFRAAVCTVRRQIERVGGRLPSEGRAVEAMFDHVMDVWSAAGDRKRRDHRVFERDGWRCTVPGCTSLRNLHAHHVVFRSAGGGNELDNQTTLCAWHHLRGVHAGRVRCSGCAPEGLRFELGIRSGRPSLLVYDAEPAPQPLARVA